MNRRQFIGIVSGAAVTAATTAYLCSDRSSLFRGDLETADGDNGTLNLEEKRILFLASLAPSGHNTQPWFVQPLEPYYWVIGNDKDRWLPAVDPDQRETILSIGTFIQNLEYAAGSFGYVCRWELLATSRQDERVLTVNLTKEGQKTSFDAAKIENRRTVRSGFSSDVLKKEDFKFLAAPDRESIHYLPADAKESRFLNEQTIEANRLQSRRDPAQQELAEWVRFSNNEARNRRDGLTTASMEIEGLAGWVVRNFYGKQDVLKTRFREQGLDKVREEVSKSAGWILITGKDDSVAALLEAGRRMQRLCLKVREKSIGIHPMTQILEESSTRQAMNQSIGISEPVQFILRTGYLKHYPKPVSLRRPVHWFLRR